MITSRKLRASQRSDQGYILVTLMLFVALMAMALAAVLPELTFQMKRDREEEMVHRGAQYARAVRAYYRKFGSYPPSIDLLVTSNNFHFLRKRYKDPVTGEDFKLLHITDVKLSFGGAMGGGTIPGAQTLGNPIGGNSNSNLNSNSNSNSNSTSSNTTDPNAASGSTNSSNNSTDASQQSSQQSGNGDSSSSNSPFTSISGNSAGPTFGGGPIVGVASTSTKESIRIYNKKDHYNDWQFIYDPTSDRGGLITGPYQPTLQAILPGQNGMPNGFPGAGAGFGGMGTPSTPGVGAPGAPTNPNMMQH